VNTQLFDQATISYDNKDYRGALRAYTACLQDTSTPFALGEIGLIYHRIGNCLVKLKNPAEAIQAYAQAAADPAYSAKGALQNNIGMAYASLRDYENAVKHFEKAVEDPAYETPYKAYMGLGNAELKLGEVLTVEELLYLVILPSYADACNVLAVAVAGDVPSFVSLMNHRSEELGLTGTHYVNAHGLHAEEHYTTARDIAVLTRLALQNETFATLVSTKNHTVPATNLSGERRFSSTNALLLPIYDGRYVYPRAIGVKTGTTSAAGKCLVSAAKRGERTLICVLLGTEDIVDESCKRTRVVFTESKRLLEWGFDSFAECTMLDSAVPLAEVGVTLSSDMTAVAVKPQGAITAILPKDLDPAEFQRDVTLYQSSVEAPVKTGQELGEVTVRNGDMVYGTVKLVAAADAERSELLSNLKAVKDFFAKPLVRIALVVLGVALVLLTLRFGVLGKRRTRYEGHDKGYRGRSRRNRR